MPLSFRRIFRSMLPGHFTAGDGGKVVYTLASLADVWLTRARLGVEARFPSRASLSSLDLIGSDRGIIRGRTETLDSYVARLKAWRVPRGHRVRGNPFALLEQLWYYWGAGLASWFTIDVNLTQCDRGLDGSTNCTYDVPWNWDSSAGADEWARAWVVMYAQPDLGLASTPAFGDGSLWGGNFNLPGHLIGITGATPDDFAKTRSLFRGRAWKPAGTRCEWLIISLDSSTPAPDGTWGRWGKVEADVYVAARDTAFRYVALSIDVKRIVGDATLYPASLTLPDGSTVEAGDPTVYPANIEMPGGLMVAGDPTYYPERIELCDDADSPRSPFPT